MFPKGRLHSHPAADPVQSRQERQSQGCRIDDVHMGFKKITCALREPLGVVVRRDINEGGKHLARGQVQLPLLPGDGFEFRPGIDPDTDVEKYRIPGPHVTVREFKCLFHRLLAFAGTAQQEDPDTGQLMSPDHRGGVMDILPGERFAESPEHVIRDALGGDADADEARTFQGVKKSVIYEGWI